MQLVLASRNPHKVQELKILLQAFPVEARDLNAFPDAPPLLETGSTFLENARQKAQTIGVHTHILTLADDSGLEVDALHGAPGVYSARYAALEGKATENAADRANNEKLLFEMQAIPAEKRSARYVCVLVLWDPQSKRAWHFEGKCEGMILPKAQGQGGFGYDPLFYLPELRCSMAEMPLVEKNKISHRARAMTQLGQAFPQILRELA